MARRIQVSDPFAQAILALAPQLLLRMVHSARSDVAQRTAAAAAELIALALDSLDSLDADAAENAPTVVAPGPVALVWRTRELISRQLDDAALTPTRLAAQVHVSLRRLQEVF